MIGQHMANGYKIWKSPPRHHKEAAPKEAMREDVILYAADNWTNRVTEVHFVMPSIPVRTLVRKMVGRFLRRDITVGPTNPGTSCKTRVFTWPTSPHTADPW